MAEAAPRLLAVVHTEEEFDWSAPFSRAATATTHVRHLDRAQELFEVHGIRPLYAIDHPIATDPAAVAALRSFLARGTAVIGAHLHPWLSPPFEETVEPLTSYPGNLPPALERAKIESLTGAIATAFDARPRVYLAGRYGFGPNTAEILEELGYEVDLSPSPPFDFRSDGGPDYRRTELVPARLGRLWQVPHTGAFVGPLSGFGAARSAWSKAGLLGRLVRGVTGRTRTLERLRLSPEGFDGAALQRLTMALIARGVRLFVFSFHSPSLAAGFTPYVRSEAHLGRFLATIDEYLGWFCTSLGGGATDPDQLVELLAVMDQDRHGP
jgi:hypothetical protein